MSVKRSLSDRWQHIRFFWCLCAYTSGDRKSARLQENTGLFEMNVGVVIHNTLEIGVRSCTDGSSGLSSSSSRKYPATEGKNQNHQRNHHRWHTTNKFRFCVSVHRSISQIKHQLDATLCRFCFCRVTLNVSGVKRPSSGVLKNWHVGPWYRCYSCR